MKVDLFRSPGPLFGDYRVVKGFALFPVKLSYQELHRTGTHVWFEHYYEIQRKCFPDPQCTGGWRTSGVYSKFQKNLLKDTLEDFLNDPRHVAEDLSDYNPDIQDVPPERKNWSSRSVMREISSP